MIRVILLYISSLLTLVTTPRYWKVLLFPLAIGVISYPIWVYLFVIARTQISALIVHSEVSWVHTLTEWLVVAFGSILSAILSFFTANIVGVFALEKLTDELIDFHGLGPVKEQAPMLGIESPIISSRTGKRYLTSIFRAICESLLQLVILGALAILSILLAWIPIFSLLALLLSAFLLGIGFVDLPFSRLDWPWRKRWSTIMNNKLATITLGAIFMCLSIVPLGAVFCMALPYIVSVPLLKSWSERNK